MSQPPRLPTSPSANIGLETDFRGAAFTNICLSSWARTRSPLLSLLMASPVSVSRVDVHLRTLRRSRGRVRHFTERGARHGLESSSILPGRTVAPSSSFCTRRRGQYSPAEPSSSRRLCPSSRYHILPSPEPQAQPLRPGIQPNPTPRPPPPVHEKEKRRYVSIDMSSGCLPCQDVGAVYMCAASGIYIFIQENASRHGG